VKVNVSCSFNQISQPLKKNEVIKEVKSDSDLTIRRDNLTLMNTDTNKTKRFSFVKGRLRRSLSRPHYAG
jgi:hypothetical protein